MTGRVGAHRVVAVAALVILAVGCGDYVGDDLRAGDYPREVVVFEEDGVQSAGGTASSPAPEATDPHLLEVGDCFDDLGERPLRAFEWGRNVGQVPCGVPHRYEVYARPQLADPGTQPWPGAAPVGELADRLCVEAFEAFVGTPWSSSELDYVVLAPDQARWGEGDARASCALFDLGLVPLTGSAEGAGR